MRGRGASGFGVGVSGGATTVGVGGFFSGVVVGTSVTLLAKGSMFGIESPLLREMGRLSPFLAIRRG